jgi:hypothetical protein
MRQAARRAAQSAPGNANALPNDPIAARALQIRRDLRALADAVLGPDSGAASAPTEPVDVMLARLGRPARSVRPTTLTPEAIDQWLDTHGGISAAGSIDAAGDEEFLRRVTLDLTGTLPSPAEIAAFRRETAPRKRADLIDRLLASPDYARNWARYWRDVIAFHATTENPLLVHFPIFESWLGEQLAANQPWDQIVRAIVTATGRSDSDGATALVSAHSTNQRFQPAEMAGETSRIFLGISIACAQCHDHPTDPWKRQQFHEFAAFFGGTRTQVVRDTRPPARIVSDYPGPPLYRMPGLNDPNTSSPIQPRFFLAATKAPPDDTSRLSSAELRTLAASYITGQDNPWFARAYVNRIWSVLMGEAFYEPIDDLGPARTARNAELLELIADQWSRGGYDVRWLFRTLMNTRAYQRSGRPSPAAAAATPESAAGGGVSASAGTGRLRADQIFDALVHALDLPIDGAAATGEEMRKAAQQGMSNNAMGPGQFSPRVFFGRIFGVDPSTPADEVSGTIPQALFLMNAPQLDQAMRARPGRLLGRLLADMPDDPAAIEALYLRVLARAPNSDELATCRAYIARVGARSEAFEDLLWALVNSTEFLSRK